MKTICCKHNWTTEIYKSMCGSQKHRIYRMKPMPAKIEAYDTQIRTGLCSRRFQNPVPPKFRGLANTTTAKLKCQGQQYHLQCQQQRKGKTPNPSGNPEPAEKPKQQPSPRDNTPSSTTKQH
eukprot:5498898-Ditylum_brightwellii.AAC.1